MAKKHVKNHLTNVNTYLIIALVIVVGIGLYFTLSVPTPEKAAEPEPAKKVQVTLLGTDCADCFNISAAVEFLKQQTTIEITEIIDVSLDDSAELTEKYSITRLPAVIITGETTNLTIPNFETNEDALVFGNSPAPYYDTEAKRVKGKVSVVHLTTPNCKECFDMKLIVEQLKQAGIKIIGETEIDGMSAEGKALVEKYSIEKLPTLIFNKEALEYDVVKQVWSEVGTEESDGKLVLRFVNPPYYNVATKQIDGLVTISYLYDESCEECFNVSVYGDILTQSFNMQYSKEEMVEVRLPAIYI